MNPSPDPKPSSDSSLARFLERVRSSFSHDLRTPLGAIVNYAAVLESTSGAEAVEVRDLGRRIRKNAQRASRMIQLLAYATAIATRPWHAATTDVVVLAQSILVDTGGRGRVSLTPNTRTPLLDVDAEVLGFAWRAYTQFEHDTRSSAVDDAELEFHAEPGHIRVELTCRGPTANEAVQVPSEHVVDLSAFLRHNAGPDRIESAMGLKLAQDLVISLGGDLTVWGRPGVRSGIRLRFPAAA